MYARRKHRYIAMMIVCVTLFVLAWGVVRFWSVPAAVGMCLVAMAIPPVAAIVANRRGADDYWWDEPNDEWLKDEPKDDTWRRDEQAAVDKARSSSRPKPHDDPDEGSDDPGAPDDPDR
jgi:hypothetical protein